MLVCAGSSGQALTALQVSTLAVPLSVDGWTVRTLHPDRFYE